MTQSVQLDHAAMRATVDRLDRVIAMLHDSGDHGSYASLREAARIAQAVQSVAEPEMADFVGQYNVGFGRLAVEYQTLCETIVSIRNTIAQTANIYLSSEQKQQEHFDRLFGNRLSEHDGHTRVERTVLDGGPAMNPLASSHPTTTAGRTPPAAS